MTEYADIPSPVLDELRRICAGLPESYEEQAWTGRRWRVRKRTFAHLFCLDRPAGPMAIVQFRADPEERDVLLGMGHPFFPGGWGVNVVNMVLGDQTDWTEVTELLAVSFCVMAPKYLARLVEPPPA